jgi:hypothetical protein
MGDLKVYTRWCPRLSKKLTAIPLDLAPISPTKFRKVDMAILSRMDEVVAPISPVEHHEGDDIQAADVAAMPMAPSVT